MYLQKKKRNPSGIFHTLLLIIVFEKAPDIDKK